MTKINEINYLNKIGEEGKKHAINKPFSDENCGEFLAEIGAIFSILPPPPLRILDLGCGTGWTSIFFAKRQYNVVGVDISSDMIKCAKDIQKKEKIKNLKFIVKDFEELDFNNKFDAVIFFDSLHHTDNEQKAINETYNSLKKGGICIICEPGKGHQNTETSLRAIKEYGVTEKDMPPKKVIKMGKMAGFTKFRVYPRPMLINFLLYKNGNKLPLGNLKKILKFNFVKIIAIVYAISFYKKNLGIITMIK